MQDATLTMWSKASQQVQGDNMTITNTRSLSHQDLTTKTEVEVHHKNTVMCTRLINSRIWQFLIAQDTPVTMDYVHNISMTDDALFMLMAKSQLPDDEDYL